MNRKQLFFRLSLAGTLIGSLGACAVVPAYPTGYYGAPPAYVETYPAYGYPSASIYYAPGGSYYDGRGGSYYGRHHDGGNGPIDHALRLRRNIHRSLGLP